MAKRNIKEVLPHLINDYLKDQSASIYEMEVFNLLNCLMTSQEKKNSVRHQKISLDNNRCLIPDIFCPDGIRNLGIEKPVAIEIKRRLILNIFENEVLKAKQYLEKFPTHDYCIIYEDSFVSFTENFDINLKLFKISELFEKLSKIFKKKYIEEQNKEKLPVLNNQNNLIKDAARSLKFNHNSFILGAGVSIDAGSPSWNDLLSKILDSNQYLKPINKNDYNIVNEKCGWSALITARYIMDNLDKNHTLIPIMRKIIYNNSIPNNYSNQKTALPVIAEIIKNCNVDRAITFNYDVFLEEALTYIGVNNTPFYDKGAVSQNEFPIFHVHGLISRNPNLGSSKLVLSESQYHSLYSNDFQWSNVEILNSLIRNTCFLVGLSMVDPNLRRLLDIARYDDSGLARHFIFMKKDSFDSKNPDPQKDFKHWFNLEQQYTQLGLNIIWYDNNPNDDKDHTDLFNKLQDILNLTKQI